MLKLYLMSVKYKLCRPPLYNMRVNNIMWRSRSRISLTKDHHIFFFSHYIVSIYELEQELSTLRRMNNRVGLHKGSVIVFGVQRNEIMGNLMV